MEHELIYLRRGIGELHMVSIRRLSELSRTRQRLVDPGPQMFYRCDDLLVL